MVLLDISGMGNLTLPDGKTVQAQVSLTVVQRNGMKSGSGRIGAEATEAWEMFAAPEGILLELQGHTAKIIITKGNGFGDMEFVTTGPVTGI